MPSEKKPLSFQEKMREDIRPADRDKSFKQIQTQQITEENPLQVIADEALEAERDRVEQEKADAKAQATFEAARTPASDLERMVKGPGAAPLRLTGTSPGTKAAAQTLETLVGGASDAVQVEPSLSNLTPDERDTADEAGLAFDIAFKAIEEESKNTNIYDTLVSFTPSLANLGRGVYRAATDDAPGQSGGAISKAYHGLSPELARITDPAKRERVKANIRDILEKEGGVDIWQGTDKEDRQSYIETKILETVKLGPNQESVARIYSMMDNATDQQYDASKTYLNLRKSYMSDLERQYRGDNPALGGARLPEDVLKEIQSVAEQRARGDIERIKTVAQPHVFVDTGAQDVVAEYANKEDTSAVGVLKGRTLDPLSVRPKAIDQIYEQAAGVNKVLPGGMVAATFLGRALEVLSLQEQGALQIEVFADNVNERVARAQDPNDPTIFEVAEGAARGLGQAALTSPITINWLRSDAALGMLTPEGEDPKDFLREADLRLLDAATDNRDFFDTFAFTLPVLATAPFGRDAQAEALTKALEYHNSAKFAAFLAAVALPDTSPLGAAASSTRKAALWAAKKARFAQWSSDLGRVASAVDGARDPQEFIEQAKKVNLSAGLAIEAGLTRESTQEQVGGIISTLAGVADTPEEAVKKAKLGAEITREQNTLDQLRKNRASAEVIQQQVARIESLTQGQFESAVKDTAEKARGLIDIEEVLEDGAKRTDNEIITEAAGEVLAQSKVADVAKVETIAGQQAFGAEQVKSALQAHPENIAKIDKATQSDATAEDVLEAVIAITDIAKSERGDILKVYAQSLESAADLVASGPTFRKASDAASALDKLRATVDEIAKLKQSSPEAAEYIEAQMAKVRAESQVAQMKEEVKRLQDRTRLLSPQDAQAEQTKLAASGVMTADEAITAAAIKEAVPEGGSLRVAGPDLFRAQDGLRTAEAAESAAQIKVAQARLRVPDAVSKQTTNLSAKAVEALKKASGKKDLQEAVDELQQQAQLAIMMVNSALGRRAAAKAVLAANDKATRREIVAITRLLRKRSDLLQRPEVMGPIKDILKRAAYKGDDSDALKMKLGVENLPRDLGTVVTQAVDDLGKSVRRQRAVGQMVSWRENARKIVSGMQQASNRLRERSDVSWTDLGWRSGDITEITRLRSRAGNAVERAMKTTNPDTGGFIDASAAVRSVFGDDTPTPNIDALALKTSTSTEDIPFDERAVRVAAQADIDLAVRKVMPDDERIALATMQSSWTEKAFLYQMKAFLDPMASYIGTSSQGLRNVYRGVVGTSQMYFVGLNGAVRKATEEIRQMVAEGGQADRKAVFGVLMKNISSYLGAAGTVSDRGAAVAGASIYERAQRTLVTDMPESNDGKAAVAAVSDADRDLLQAVRDTKVTLPGDVTEEQAQKALVRKKMAVDKAQAELDALTQKEAALRAEAAKTQQPDPRAVPAQTLTDMNLAALELVAKRDAAAAEVERIKNADVLDFLDESPLGTKLGELKKHQDDIKDATDDLTVAKADLRVKGEAIEALKAKRDGITRETLGAKKTRQIPDDENLMLPSELRDRLVVNQRAASNTADALDDVQDAAQSKARENPEVLRELLRLDKVEEAIRARLSAARQKLDEIPERAPLGSNSTAHRARRTRAENLVRGIEEEVSGVRSQADSVLDAEVVRLLGSDPKLKKMYEEAQQEHSKALSRLDTALAKRDEVIAKAKAAPILASPEEVKAARKVVQDEIDARLEVDIKPAKKTVGDLEKKVSETQRKIDKVYKEHGKAINDDAVKVAVLEAVRKEKLAEAQKALAEADKVARNEMLNVKQVTDAADAAVVEATSRAEKAKAQLQEADEIKASLVQKQADVEALRLDAQGLENRLADARRSAEMAAREVAIARLSAEPGRLEAVTRLANAEAGQADPDRTLVRLGRSVLSGVQAGPEAAAQAANIDRMAADVAREALASSTSFDEMYDKMIGLWAGKYGMSSAVTGQDAKSMSFAAAALIEGATRDLAIEATLREGIGMVDPRAAKAMAQISRLASGNGTLKTSDLSADDVRAAILGFLKIGQMWNRTVEGKASAPSLLGGGEKADRNLGLFLASVRDIKVDNQTIYLPRALAEALTSEMDLMRKEIDLLPSQSPNTLINKWLVDTTRDVMRFMRTTMLIGYGINLLGYRFKTLAGDVEQIYYAIGAKEALQAATAAPLQMIPFKGAVAVDAAHKKGTGQLAGQIRRGLNEGYITSLPASVQKAVREVGNPLADFVQGTFDPDIGKVIASVATSPDEKLTFGKMTKTRAEWLEEAARQGAFDTNVEAGMRKTIRDVRDMIGQVTTRRMTWADAVEAGKARGESPYKLYLMRQRVPLKEDEVLSKPGMVERVRVALIENQRALEAREADVQRTTRQMLYFRLRQQGLSEQEAGDVMRRGLLDWSHGLNRTVASVISYMPFWRYHLLSFKQGFNLLFGGSPGATFDRAQKLLRAYDGFYEGAPTEEEIALVRERARSVARNAGRSEEQADVEVSTFLAAKQFALGNVPRFIRDGGQAYSVSHVSGFDYGDLGTGMWQANYDSVGQARRDYRDPAGKATTWRVTAAPRSSIVGAMDVAATMSLLMESAYAYASDDVQASEAALLKAGTTILGRMPTLMRETVENAILSMDPVANAAYGGDRAYANYGRVSPAEADIAELLGVPLVSTPDDPRPMAPKAFRWLFSLPLVGVAAPVAGQVRDVYKAAKYTNPYAYDESTLKQAIGTPLAMWGIMRTYGFDPAHNQSLENAMTTRAANEVVKQAEKGSRFYVPR